MSLKLKQVISHRAVPLAGVVIALLSTQADAAPAQLYNKSIRISFSVSILSKGSDGSTMNTPRTSNRVIYISSQGRVFARAQHNAGRSAETKERGPGESNLQFVGNQLVGVLPMISGAGRLSISFDSSYSSCTGEVIVGAESGKSMVFQGMNGITYTAIGKPQISAISCSISDGNALVN